MSGAIHDTHNERNPMSTNYRLLSPIYIADILDECSKDVKEHKRLEGSACLTDGRNFIWADFDPYGLVSSFTRWAPNGDPRRILNAIAETFDVEIVSEHRPQYWEFKTVAEWDAYLEALSEPTDG
jgi:hypothetical protein